MIHFVSSTYQPSIIWYQCLDVKLISIINNVGVVSNFKRKVEYSYKNRIPSLCSEVHKLAASATYLWKIKTKVILVIPVSYQISFISENSSSNYSRPQFEFQIHPVVRIAKLLIVNTFHFQAYCLNWHSFVCPVATQSSKRSSLWCHLLHKFTWSTYFWLWSCESKFIWLLLSPKFRGDLDREVCWFKTPWTMWAFL